MKVEQFEMYLLTLFRMGGEQQKGFSYQFSPVTFTNVGISAKSFLNRFNPFTTLI